MPKATKLSGEYAERGEYHKCLDPGWPYYPTYLAKMKFVKQRLQKVSSISKILDVGCGEGVLVEEFLQKDYDIIGLDRDYSSQYVIQGDITKMPFSNKCFDVILCLDVIEHLYYDQQEKAMSEVNRVLKQDGILIISIPNLAHLFSRIKFFLTGELSRTANIKKHLGDRPIKEYLKLLEASGFRMIERKGLFPTFPVFYQVVGRSPSKTIWIYNLFNKIFAYPDLCFLNILVCKKYTTS